MNRLPRQTILVGDAHARLRVLPPASIDCVITSPPYWALRNYGMQTQLGLEASVNAWVAGLLPVFDELARVLKPEGALWLNVGDSFSRHPRHGAPAKSLVLAPERLALKLVARNWVLRNKVVWTKPNARPTSITDRLACTWEYVFFFVRSRRYAFDLDAIRVPHRSAVRLGRSGSPASGG